MTDEEYLVFIKTLSEKGISIEDADNDARIIDNLLQIIKSKSIIISFKRGRGRKNGRAGLADYIEEYLETLTT